MPQNATNLIRVSQNDKIAKSIQQKAYSKKEISEENYEQKAYNLTKIWDENLEVKRKKIMKSHKEASWENCAAYKHEIS